MYILGIETTCDETACAIVQDGFEILGHTISSQIDLHSVFGGVVPELASRRHIDIIRPVVEQTVAESGLTLRDIDAVAVAKGPGLIGALLVGIHFAQGLSWSLQKPLIGINHIEAHLYAAIMSQKTAPLFPSLGIVLSGGHTSLVKIFDIGNYELIGETIDDAIGEAFDKAAKILGLGYPGGPIIETHAREGNPHTYPFKGGQVKKRPLDFSFSGIKTKLLYTVRGQNGVHETEPITPAMLNDLCASFQRAVFDDVLAKTRLALTTFTAHAIYLGGGVTQNKYLRALFEKELPIPSYWPSFSLCLDNAAMIAGLAFHKQPFTDELLTVQPETRMPF